MPIRTHRGRAAVYRRLWGWPLRSPKHLVGAVVLIGVVVTAVGFLLPEQTTVRPRGADRSASGRPAAEQPPPKPSPPSFRPPTGAPAPSAPDPEGLAVAEKWGQQWVNHPPGVDRAQWAERLRPYTSDEFLPLMSSVDPANVPAKAITGPVTSMRSSGSSMDVRLPTDAGDIRVQVIRAPQGWRVAGYNEVG